MRSYLIYAAVLLAILSTLFCSSLFVYPTLASYFFFFPVALGITVFAGGYLLVKKTAVLPLSYTLLLLLVTGMYVLLSGLFVSGIVIDHYYLWVVLLLGVSLTILFRNMYIQFDKLYLLISIVSVFEAVVCMLQALQMVEPGAQCPKLLARRFVRSGRID